MKKLIKRFKYLLIAIRLIIALGKVVLSVITFF